MRDGCPKRPPPRTYSGSGEVLWADRKNFMGREKFGGSVLREESSRTPKKPYIYGTAAG